MKKIIFAIEIFFLLFYSSLITSAIQITEVELNPSGNDVGTEWIELYSQNEVNLSGFSIKNNDGNDIQLNETFSGYFIYLFGRQWLDNSDEKIFLYEGSNLIDETEIFADDKDNDLTWQLCSGKWNLLENTKSNENDCQQEDSQENEQSSENGESETAEEIEENLAEENKEKLNEETEKNITEKNVLFDYKTEKENAVLETIKLNKGESLEIQEDEKQGVQGYAIYGFISFCVLLTLLFLIRRKHIYKNEFKEP
jgi:hypothetical protein